MIKFTEITDRLDYPAKLRGQLASLHADVIDYAIKNFTGTFRFKEKCVSAINAISYIILNSDSMPADWDKSNPLENLPDIEDKQFKLEHPVVPAFLLNSKELDWSNIKPVAFAETSKLEDTRNDASTINKSVTSPYTKSTTINPTPKEDLYIRPPIIPSFDYRQVWFSGVADHNTYVIYNSLPEVPTKQNEISCTTDISKMTTNELMKLYPNHFIRTRSASMYEPIEGIKFHPTLGLLIPIDDYTESQIIDNIVKYPHFFQLKRLVDGELRSFYSNIEIDGQLYDTLSIWESLPESDKIPRNSDFIKEYVVRRYLLERDVRGIIHRYPIYGSLDPFLTLFTTSDDYIRLGYRDVESIVKQCVAARVKYKQTRNPILRRLGNV